MTLAPSVYLSCPSLELLELTLSWLETTLHRGLQSCFKEDTEVVGDMISFHNERVHMDIQVSDTALLGKDAGS